MSFHSNLAERLDALEWGPEHLSAAMSDLGHHIQARTIYRWLSGESAPRAETIPFIAKAVGCTADQLFRDAARDPSCTTSVTRNPA